jgi:hypothetical protein
MESMIGVKRIYCEGGCQILRSLFMMHHHGDTARELDFPLVASPALSTAAGRTSMIAAGLQ